ncbi:hypothetical protein CYY_003774 [Polysphondylium violaceum]|uniref:GAT domain-containing protein n=1 Tax=Polysphondylium violaceum TaxID=133409 RepID=A0A8J4UTX6_9MYCE|nr:hypothetical protein CYY_003774 [Polysphondylium violaceum]
MTNAVELVDKATSEYLIQLDWTIALQICDMLNKDSIHARGVIRQILKRFKERSRVILLALELSDCLLQNCQCTHIYFAERTFQTEMARLIMNKKSKEPVKDKALELVDRWGKAFERRSDLSGFYDTYSFISRSGYRFPPRRPDAPVINFNNPPSSQRKPSNGSMNNFSSTTSSGGSGSSHQPPTNQEISSIKGSVSVFSEMISFLNIEDEDPSENDLIKELLEACKKSQARIKEMIESGTTSERDLGSLLTLNDEVNRALNDYEACLKKRNAFVMNGYKPVQQPPQQVHYQNNNNNNSNNMRPNNNNNNSILSKHKELEEIDFFAAPDGVNPFALQPYQPQPQQQQQQQQNPMMMNNQQQNGFNPFAPQPQQQQQQFNSFQPQPQQQQRPSDDFDLLISNRQSTQNPFSYNNNGNGNGALPATAKSLPQQNFNNRPFNPNTQTLPSAPPIFNSPPNNPFTNNNNNNSSPTSNNNMFANNNNNNNNLSPNNNNALSLNNRPFPNYNAIRNDDPFSGGGGGGFNNNQQQNMNPYGFNPQQQQQQQQNQPMMYNPMMQQQMQQQQMMNPQQQQNQNYSHFTQYVPNPNQPYGMNNNQNQPTTKLW